jgi:diacylglycerol kinase (ATP)
MTPLGFWLGRDAVETSLLVGTLLLVVIIELLNSGIEAVVDRIGDEPHKLSGRAKDMGSAAVLICLLMTAMSWFTIGWKNFA